MVENRRENTRRTPYGRSLSLARQVREPLRELLRVDARPGPVADAHADPGADAGSDNATARKCARRGGVKSVYMNVQNHKKSR